MRATLYFFEFLSLERTWKELLRRFLQHLLHHGFVRIRHSKTVARN